MVGCFGCGRLPALHPRHPGALFLVQPLLHGPNLAAMVQQASAAAAVRAQPQSCQVHHEEQNHSDGYSSKEGLEWLLQVAGALEYLHSTTGGKTKVIHR